MPRAHSVIELRDGRTLGYAEVGPSDGRPILHFHGNGTSRLEVFIVEAAAEAAGVRLIGLDRPGVGLSSPKPGYRLLDWPNDVAEAADELGLEHFAVEGLSGGAPFALACAYRIPQRLTGCALISPASGPFLSQAGPLSLRIGTWLLLHAPWLIRGGMRLSARFIGRDAASIEKTLIRNASRLGPADQRLFQDDAVRKAFVRAVVEGYRQAVTAPTEDGRVFSGPWGFRAEEVGFERLFLWQGEQDRVMPAAAASLLAQALPRCTANFLPDDGHLSTFVNHAEEIWRGLRA